MHRSSAALLAPKCCTIFALSCTIFSLLSPDFSHAQSSDNIISEQDWITRQQQNTLEEKKRDAEFDTIKKEHERQKKEQQKSQTENLTISDKTAGCFLIKEIQLLDAYSLSKKERGKITEPFLEKCFKAEILQNLVAAVTNYYQSQGYVTVQILIPKQNVQGGILELKIIEGKIERISLNQNSFSDRLQKFTAFGNKEGAVLNANDISQGMYQINRLASNAATMQIKPGSADGLSEIVISNNKKFPARATIGYDNLGNDFTGVRRSSFSGAIDNLLSLNDNFNLNYTTNLNDNSQAKDIKSFYSGITIPFGYHSFSYDYSHSEFRGIVLSNGVAARYTGFSQQSKISLERVLLNNAKLRITSNNSLTAKNSASYQNGDKQPNSERKLTILNIGIALSSYLNESTNFYLKPSYSSGLKLLNAKKDEDNLSKDDARAQFEVFKFYANFSKKFSVPKINIPLTYVAEIDSQYAQDTLFGSEQFSVGGYYSVRGFREDYITGDSGYYLRNKINFNLGSLLPLLKKENPHLAHLNNFKIEPFFDYGYTKYKYSNNGADGRLSGTGIKTIFEGKYFTAALTYSWALNKSRLITSAGAKENKLLYFEISASCC